MAIGVGGGSGSAMLRWAFGYLAMAILVAVGFSSLSEVERPERRVAAPVAKHGAATARGERVAARDLEDDEPADWEEPADEDVVADEDVAADEDMPADEDMAAEGDATTDEDAAIDEDAPADEEVWEHVVEAGPSGHFLIEAWVNGEPITFLVDTGASDIVLTPDDARRIGLEPRTLEYTQSFATANGEVRAAPVVLREIRVGELQLFDLDASVNEAALPVSLLGMSFLEELSGYEVQGRTLILRW
jgi:clan AA aspartic protease (TIGR02281 family)